MTRSQNSQFKKKKIENKIIIISVGRNRSSPLKTYSAVKAKTSILVN